MKAPYSFRSRLLYSGIQWRLTATYVAVTVFTILAVEVAVALDWIPRSLTLLLVAAGLTSAAFGFITARVIKLRLRAIARASAAIADGDLSQRLTVDGDDEIAELTEQFNDMAARLDSNAVELRRLAATTERSRLASELHDSVNQQIFSISMMAAAVRKKLGDHSLAPEVAHLETLARETHAEMRALIRELRPTALDGSDLATALNHYVSDFNARYGLSVVVDAQSPGRLPLDLETALFRIAQEALGNAVRHSAAKNIHLGLHRDGNELALSVQDDGHGFDMTAHSDGLGLHSMRERAQSVGGTYHVVSAPGEGCTVRVRVPLW